MLDVFRIILCIGVVVYHYTPERPSSGPFMVIGFFVMSGFLLGLYFNGRSELNVNDFYCKKSKRLLPLFIAALLMGVGCKIVKFASTLDVCCLLPPYTAHELVNCNIAKVIMWYNTPLWYMVVELTMLLFAPLYFVLYKKRRGFGTIALLVSTLSVSVFLYFQLTRYPTLFAGELYFSSLYRAWQFIAGLAAAQLYCYMARQERQNFNICSKYLTAFLGAIFLFLSLCFMFVKQGRDLAYWNYDIRFDVACVAFYFCLIPLLFHQKIELSDRWRNMLAYAAELTYPMYLVHCLMLIASKKSGVFEGWWEAGLAFVLSIIVSAVMLKIQKIFNRRENV